MGFCTTFTDNFVKAIAQEYAERLWDDRDLSAIDELLDEEVAIRSLAGNFRGRDAMREVVTPWMEAFPDLLVENMTIICEDDSVCIHWQAQGTHQAEFGGIPATGKRVSYAGATIYRIREAKIVEYSCYTDMQKLIKQLVN